MTICPGMRFAICKLRVNLPQRAEALLLEPLGDGLHAPGLGAVRAEENHARGREELRHLAHALQAALVVVAGPASNVARYQTLFPLTPTVSDMPF